VNFQALPSRFSSTCRIRRGSPIACSPSSIDTLTVRSGCVAASSSHTLRAIAVSVDELPPDAMLDRQSYASLGLRSHVGMPVMVSGEFVAVLGFGSLRNERRCRRDYGRKRRRALLLGRALANQVVEQRDRDKYRRDRGDPA